jgi:hypothetical protein
MNRVTSAVAGRAPAPRKSEWPGWAEIRHTLSMRGDGSTLRILGPVELTGPAGPVRLGAAKERCLLAVFALHLGEAVQWERPERVAHDLDALLRKGQSVSA